MAAKKNEVTIYTDGGCQRNPGGKGGIGIVLLCRNARKEISIGYESTTNNRMELRAAIEGLKALKMEGMTVTLFSDSQYVVNSVEKGWVFRWQRNGWKKSKNVDLWREILQLLKKHTVRFIWVRGHDCTVENNRCDKLATQAMRSTDLLPDTGYLKVAHEIF